MHPMAKTLSAAGYPVYALDIRGHGGSGRKGHIAFIGRLEDDLADFVHAVLPAQPVTLAGFSSGGGFAIRFAGATNRIFSKAICCSLHLSDRMPRLSALHAAAGRMSACLASSRSQF